MSSIVAYGKSPFFKTSIVSHAQKQRAVGEFYNLAFVHAVFRNIPACPAFAVIVAVND